MSTPDSEHPCIAVTPPPGARDADDGADALSGHVATMPDAAATEGASNLEANGAEHNVDLDGDGADGEDDTGWPSTLLAVRSLMSLARKPRVYQRVNVEPKPVLPPRVRKRPIKVEEGLEGQPTVPPPQIAANPHRRALLVPPPKMHDLRKRKTRPDESGGEDDKKKKEHQSPKRPVKPPKKKIKLDKPKEPVLAIAPPAQPASSPITTITGPWHYNPFMYVPEEDRVTRGGYMSVLDAYRGMKSYPKPAEMQAAIKEVHEFHRQHGTKEKLAGLTGEAAAIFLASVSSRRTSTQLCPCDPACKETQSNFLGVRRHILSHSVFHLHCMALDPKTGKECRATVLGGRTSALIRHLRIHHHWQQWQFDEMTLVDGYTCWPRWACTLVHPPGVFHTRTAPSKG